MSGAAQTPKSPEFKRIVVDKPNRYLFEIDNSKLEENQEEDEERQKKNLIQIINNY